MFRGITKIQMILIPVFMVLILINHGLDKACDYGYCETSLWEKIVTGRLK